MCKDCGCPADKVAQIKFFVTGYTDSNVKEIEKALLGLAGVNNVHIHAHDGLTAIVYNPVKTPVAEITAFFKERGLQAII